MKLFYTVIDYFINSLALSFFFSPSLCLSLHGNHHLFSTNHVSLSHVIQFLSCSQSNIKHNMLDGRLQLSYNSSL